MFFKYIVFMYNKVGVNFVVVLWNDFLLFEILLYNYVIKKIKIMFYMLKLFVLNSNFKYRNNLNVL